jgi:hypothetical protein
MRENVFHSCTKIASVGGLAALLLTFVVCARAQCGGSLDALAASALSIQSKTRSGLTSTLVPKDQSFSLVKGDSDEDQSSSIVGLWHIKFNITVPGVPDPITIQEAFQIWNAGGTEVHNPNVDPRGGSVCLGSWTDNRGTFKLTHRVWSYSTDGIWLGTINLNESVRVVDRGRRQTGNFSLDFFDPAGNPTPPVHVEGNVVAERISPE